MRFLIVDWSSFIPALVLLLTPIGLFHGRRIQFRPVSRDWERYWGPTLTLPLHWIDFVRAAAGAWLLIRALPFDPTLPGMARYTPLIAQGMIRIVAVFLQCAVCRERDAIHAPYAFVTGMLLGGVSPIGAVVGLALTLPLVMGSRSPVAFFPVLAITFYGAAVLFGKKKMFVPAAPGAVALMIPWLWSLMFERDLVVSHRAKRDDHPDAHGPLR